MSRIIKSPAFLGGHVAVSTLDDDEAWIASHPHLVAWVGGSSVSMRRLDWIWDDWTKPALSYYPSASGEARARPAAGINGRPSIRCAGSGLKCDGLTLPPTMTAFVTASVDVFNGTSQILLAGRNNTSPRWAMMIGSTGALASPINTGSNISHPGGPVTPGVPFLAAFSLDDATKAARLYLNAVEPVSTATFGEGVPQQAGFGVGQTWAGASPLTGHVGDGLIFGAVLPDADRARVMRYLSRRSGVQVAGV